MTIFDYLMTFNLTGLLKYHSTEHLANMFGTSRVMISKVTTEQFRTNKFSEMNYLGMDNDWVNSEEKKSLIQFKKDNNIC